jgi:gentisate 1,2-dioxygenase
MNPKEDQSGAMIAPAAQVRAYSSTKIQKENYSFHEKPYFKTPSWQKTTVT